MDAVNAAEGDRRNADLARIIGPVQPTEFLRSARPPHEERLGAYGAAVFFLVGFTGTGACRFENGGVNWGHAPLVFDGVAPEGGVDNPQGDQLLVDPEEHHRTVGNSYGPLVHRDVFKGGLFGRARRTATACGRSEGYGDEQPGDQGRVQGRYPIHPSNLLCVGDSSS